MKNTFIYLALVSTVTFGNSMSYLNSLTSAEKEEVEQRLSRFYDENAPEAMQVIAPKYSVRDEVIKHPHAKLKDKKTDPAFRAAYCKNVLKKHFPTLSCGQEFETWEAIQSDDKVEDLTDTWMEKPTHDLDEIPTEGKSELPLWSDDYWRTKWGYTSYRYSAFDPAHESMKYPKMIALYSQPSDFESLLTLPLAKAEKAIVGYSPSEKYDLTVGDTSFTLTNEQKNEGKSNIGSNGDVEEWMGLCHGWAPAALMVERPMKPVTVTGPNEMKVTWYPADIKALLTLQWSNGNYENNFVGGRCGDKKPKLHRNGRLKNPECFDNNPATFHLAAGNMIGREKASFVIDKTFDYEVWNQPVVSYEFTYFNPLKPSERSKKWSEVAVAYNAAFKKKDRFQKPLTRGRGIDQVVGVIATIVYVSELSPPEHTPEPQEDELLRMTMTYDLELSEKDGKLVATGGEWHENAHPDFMWVPKKAAFASMAFDKTDLNYEGAPTEKLTETAKKSSPNAYPLCQVMQRIVKQSTGKNSVRCMKTN